MSPTIIITRHSGLRDRYQPMGRYYGRAVDAGHTTGTMRTVVAPSVVTRAILTAQRQGLQVTYV